MTGGKRHLKFKMCPSKVFLQLLFHVNVFQQVHVLHFLCFLCVWKNSALNHRNLYSMMDKPLTENLFHIWSSLPGNKLEKGNRLTQKHCFRYNIFS